MKLTLVRCLTFVFLLAAILSATAATAQTSSTKAPQAQNNNDMIAGVWMAGDTKYALDKSGASIVTLGNKACPGTWAVKGNTLTISPKKMNWRQGDLCAQTMVLEVVNVTAEGMDLTDAATKIELHVIRQIQY